MEIISGSDLFRTATGVIKPLYLALGNFDGVHRGHQQIISKTVQRAQENSGCSAAYILNPHPLLALDPGNGMALLTDIADRAQIFGELGLDYLVLEPFEGKLPCFSPQDFAKIILCERLGASGVFVGSNYHFGYRGAGSAETLSKLGSEFGFSVEQVAMVQAGGKTVSSSLVRELVKAGEVKAAAFYLNYYFFRYGRVVKGAGIGRLKLLPTANVVADPGFLWPGQGVYLTAVSGLDNLYFGLSNVGAKPTFDSYNEKMVETHLLNFTGDLYGREIRIHFLEKIRETQRFASVEQLKAALVSDVERAKNLLPAYEKVVYGNRISLQAGLTVLRS